MATCLLLKHPVAREDAAGRLEQIEHIKALMRAINTVNLTLLDSDPEGTAVTDITDVLIEQVHEANVVIIDANRYGNEHLPPSASLYYLMALSHSCGNKTILVARSMECIPFAALRKQHTLILGDDVWRFLDELKRAVKEILDGNSKPDNPVQEYLKDLRGRKLERELAQTKAERAAEQAELRKLRSQSGQPKITFRRVTPPLDES